MRERIKNTLKWWRESSTDTNLKSLLIGFGVIILLAVGLMSWSQVKQFSEQPQPTPAETLQPLPKSEVDEMLPIEALFEEENGQHFPLHLPAKYRVQAGDSTWKIAKAYFNSGLNYVDIEQANGLKHDQGLEIGQELTIPRVPTKATHFRVLFKGERYTVQAGDSLWSIAEKFYKNANHPMDWREIEVIDEAFDHQHPDRIEPGMIVYVPMAMMEYPIEKLELAPTGVYH